MNLRSAATSTVKAVGLYHWVRDLRRSWRFHQKSRRAIARWKTGGEPVPPPDAIKYQWIERIARKHRVPTLVETGTFYGDAIFALRGVFREIHTIELAPGLYELNRREFAAHSHIHVHFGDSAKVLPEVVRTLTAPILFWLDGHYCAGPSARADKDTPVSEELLFLLTRHPSNNVILIDDARLFNGVDGYPSIAALRELAAQHRPDATLSVIDDIIQIIPV